MIDATQAELEAARPREPAEEAIAYCPRRLYEDGEHRLADLVAPHLTYEELVGALLLGLDAARERYGGWTRAGCGEGFGAACGGSHAIHIVRRRMRRSR